MPFKQFPDDLNWYFTNRIQFPVIFCTFENDRIQPSWKALKIILLQIYNTDTL